MRTDEDDRLISGVATLLSDHGLFGEVKQLRRLSGGASRETWSLDLDGPEGSLPLILQRQRAGTGGSGPGMVTEAALIDAAGSLGVPVPRVVASDSGDTIGAPCMVMDRLDGETIARKLLRDDVWATARSVLVAQAGHALAAVHRIDPGVAPSLRAADQLEEMRALLHGFDQPLPAFELGIRWLEQNRPPPSPPAVVHGDFRLGNLLVGEEGLVGVLDWELAHLGDPVEDLGWYCVRAWRFGSALPAGGMGTRAELIAAYEEAGGGTVDPEALRWWELLGTLKWGLICVMQADVHLSGAARSVELAAIGRRVCENEWDVLALLPGEDLAIPYEVVPASVNSLYGRPTAGELVEAVREWVERDVQGATEGRVAFHARVAVNALRMVERELSLASAHAEDHAAQLAALGVADEAALAREIRSGGLDDRASEVRAVVAASVRAKLEVANPRWLQPDG